MELQDAWHLRQDSWSWAWNLLSHSTAVDSASESYKPDVYVSKFGPPQMDGLYYLFYIIWWFSIICSVENDFCWCPNMGMICRYAQICFTARISSYLRCHTCICEPNCSRRASEIYFRNSFTYPPLKFQWPRGSLCCSCNVVYCS